MVEEKGLITEDCDVEILKNIFGKITEINKKVYVTIELDGIIMTTECLIGKFEDSKKRHTYWSSYPISTEKVIYDLTKLTKEFPRLFDEKKSDVLKDIMCEINTPKGKKVNIKYRSTPQALVKGAQETINTLLNMGYINNVMV